MRNEQKKKKKERRKSCGSADRKWVGNFHRSPTKEPVSVNTVSVNAGSAIKSIRPSTVVDQARSFNQRIDPSRSISLIEPDQRRLIPASVIIHDTDASLPVCSRAPPHQLFSAELLCDAQMRNKSKSCRGEKKKKRNKEEEEEEEETSKR